jgi:hypothetical protein
VGRHQTTVEIGAKTRQSGTSKNNRRYYRLTFAGLPAAFLAVAGGIDEALARAGRISNILALLRDFLLRGGPSSGWIVLAIVILRFSRFSTMAGSSQASAP